MRMHKTAPQKSGTRMDEIGNRARAHLVRAFGNFIGERPTACRFERAFFLRFENDSG